MENGASAEIAVVGNEGLHGISLFMGGDTTPSRAVVQSDGHGFKVKADLLKTEFERFGAAMHLLLRIGRINLRLVNRAEYHGTTQRSGSSY
jgi:hypothetical protein